MGAGERKNQYSAPNTENPLPSHFADLKRAAAAQKSSGACQKFAPERRLVFRSLADLRAPVHGSTRHGDALVADGAARARAQLREFGDPLPADRAPCLPRLYQIT